MYCPSNCRRYNVNTVHFACNEHDSRRYDYCGLYGLVLIDVEHNRILRSSCYTDC